MKNKLVVIMALLALPMTLSMKNRPSEVKAEESTLKNNIYEEDFEELSVGDSGDAIYKSKNLFWFDGGVNASIVESKGSKALQYEVNSSTSDGFTVFGGIGTGAISNLAKLVTGERYVFSADLTMSGTTDSSELFLEYQVDSWTGVKVSNNNVNILDTASTFNAKYENGKVSFTFLGGKQGTENGWIKITSHNFTNGAKVVLDNFTITKETLGVFDYDMNFENLAIGTNAPANNLSNIGNVYNGTVDLSLTIQGDENNHYLEAKKDGTGSDVWDKFYINSLQKLTSDANYRISMDVLEATCSEFYICYNESGQPCVTYNPSGYVGKDSSEYLLGGTFDGQHLTFDFKPSVTKDSNWWQQVAIIIKHSSDMVMKFDNIRIFKLGNMTSEFNLETSNTKLEYGVNEQLDLSKLTGVLLRKDGTTRAVTNKEMIIDTSAVDVSNKGTYQVTVKVVDEFEEVFMKNLEITIRNYADEFIEDWANLRKNAGSEGICYYLTTETRADLDVLIARYKTLSESDRNIVNAAKDGGTTIANTIEYVTQQLAVLDSKDKNVASGTIITANNNYDKTTMIVLFMILGIATISGYYVIEKRKKS